MGKYFKYFAYISLFAMIDESVKLARKGRYASASMPASFDGHRGTLELTFSPNETTSKQTRPAMA